MRIKMKLMTNLLVLLSVIVCVMSKNYFYGNKTTESSLVYRERILLEAIPFKKRVQVLEYKNSPKPIKAIYCYDYQNSEATTNITEGGVGFHHVTLRMKSQRNYRLDYAVQIYA